MVQIRNSALKTEMGIELVSNTTETEFDNTQTARVVAAGPLAFCNRETGEPWPEKAWCQVGDYVRIPKYGKETWRRPNPKGGAPITYSMIDDLQIIGVVTGDPLDFQAFL